jgi:catalase
MSRQLSARDGTSEKGRALDLLKRLLLLLRNSLLPSNSMIRYMATDSGTPIDEAVSLKAGLRRPTLLEDFVFRQKLQRFDHERVP